MTSQAKPKPTSRWGLGSVISGIESRLDTILTDDPQASAKSRQADAEAKQVAATLKLEQQSSSRPPSRNRQGGTLQDRLAKAVAAKQLEAQKSSATALGEGLTASPRTSIDSRRSESLLEPSFTLSDSEALSTTSTIENALNEVKSMDSTEEATRPNVDVVIVEPEAEDVSESARPSQDSAAPPPEASISISPDIPPPATRPRSSSILETELSLLQQTYTETVDSHKTELNTQLERIDALQTKLNYLSNLLSEQTSRSTAELDTPAIEKKLAEKDATITALTVEGTKLSKTEHDLRDIIKKLRATAGEKEKEGVLLKQRLAKAEQQASEAQERASRAEATEKSSAEKLKIVAKIEREFTTLRDERETAGLTISELRRQLSDAVTWAEEAEKHANSGQLEAERRAVAELKDELADAKIEKKLAEDRSKAEIKDLKEQVIRKEELAKVTEMELKSEISTLETKLEVLRSRTEEVSSSASGDSQAKLLRQIETLQTQYVLASENWQGIETTLTSRVASLEKERDEISKRESDIRRKAREVNSKARRVEDELESANDRIRALEQEIQEQKSLGQKLQARLTTAEKTLEDARADFAKEKKVWESELSNKIEEEKLKWRLESPSIMATESISNSQFLRAEPSPGFGSFRKSQAPDALGIYSRRLPRAKSGTELCLSPPSLERPPSSRRSSTQPMRTPDIGTFTPPLRQNSTPSIAQTNGTRFSVPIEVGDDAFETASSQRRTINDMISVSTSGAGPSVQLVERMSAAVRRLESEKATLKEEMSRLNVQRDDAREEVVSLMRENDEKKSLQSRIEKLEKALQEKDQRYETTLEMLGEKSERVEELMNDIQDLKQIHRDLMESLVK